MEIAPWLIASLSTSCYSILAVLGVEETDPETFQGRTYPRYEELNEVWNSTDRIYVPKEILRSMPRGKLSLSLTSFSLKLKLVRILIETQTDVQIRAVDLTYFEK